MKIKYTNNGHIHTLLVFVVVFFSIAMGYSQTITGLTNVNQGTTNTYSISGVSNVSWNVSGAASWSPSGSTVNVTAGSGNYTVSASYSQAPNFSALFVNVTPTGPTPPSTPPTPTVTKFCDYTRLTRANPPSGVTYYWQSTSSGQSTSNSSSSVDRVNGTIYYLRARGNSSGLWSAIRSVSYTIDYAPSAPLSPSITNNCGTTVLTRDNPNPTANVTWYWQNSATGTSTGNSQTTITLSSGTVYYLRAKTNGVTCWGPARTINYTVDNGPATPAAPSIQSSSCGNVVLARTTPPSGVTFYWQSSSTGTSTSNSSSTINLSSGSTYYLRGRNSNGCWSSASSVNYTISTAPVTPSPPTISANNCDNTVLARLNPPNGVTWYWQDSSSGTSTANSSSTITKTNGTVQYLRARNSAGCWSNNASSLTYDINYSPSAPLSPTITNNCGSTILTRDNPNPTANVTWYWQSSATGTSTGNSQPTITLSTGTVYYLRAKTNGATCWGPARTVNYTVDNGPATPATPTIASNDCGSTVLSRTNPPSGVTYYWQTAAAGTSTSEAGASITLTSGTTHYLRARNNSSQCWSTASSVSYTINTPPATPTAPTISETNCGDTVLAKSNAPSGVTWYWQDTATGTNTDNSSTTVTKINGTIQYLRAKANGADCWSAASSSVTYTVTSGPSAPLSPTVENFCGSTVLTRDNPNPTAPVAWYWQDTADGTSITNDGLTVTLTSGTVYYLRAKTNGSECWGEPRVINYTVDQIPGTASGNTISRCGIGTIDLIANLGTNGDTLRWYDVENGGTPLGEGENFTTESLSATKIYYVETYNSVTDCVSPTRHAIQAEISTDIIWYLDADNDGLGDPNNASTPSCTQPAGYVNNNNDQCPAISSSTNNCDEPNNPLDQNYVYVRNYQAKRTSATPFFTANDSLIQTINYFDGLGRGIQQIGIDHTPDKDDIVTFMDYDDYGRMNQEYLPYSETDDNLATYRLSAESKTVTHYATNKYQNTTNPFSEIAYEASPLNRTLKQAAPGEAWKMGNAHEIEFEYLTNTAADNVKRYRVTLNFADNTYTPTLIVDGNYPAGELTKSITKDENHTSGKDHTTETFTDKQGRVILKRTYNNEQAHDTQYVYDDFGNLSYVLTPKMEPSTSSISQINSDLVALGYRYVYDQRNRLVIKQIPGKGEEHIVYNTLDQPLMTQDANQRISNEWLFTKYDQFGRVAYTGKAIDSNDRETTQDIVNNLTTPLWVIQGDQENYGGTSIFYNNGAYPTSSLTEVLTINYYDNYNTARSGTATSVTAFGVTSSSNVQGLPTENKVRILDVSPAQWITSVVYYDQKGRTIQSYSQNEYLATTDKIELKLDYTGRTLQSRSEHSRNGVIIATLDNFTYDHVGRLMTQTQCIGDASLGYSCDGATGGGAPTSLILTNNVTSNQTATNSILVQPNASILPNSILQIDPNATGGSGNAELIVLNNYDALGRLESKKVGGISDDTDVLQSTGLQTVNYNYNVREWLTGINDNDPLDNDLSIDGNDLFAFKLDYNNPVAGGIALYNGNISKTLWRTKSENQSLRSYTYSYDALNRIQSGIDNTTDQRYSLSNVTYDKNGNIETLSRNGHTNIAATTFGQMDNLTYEYNGNQLLQVTDDILGVTGDRGFKDGNKTGVDYNYDTNGNMVMDKNKGIGTDGLTYNHLNLPVTVNINNGSDVGTISYIYDATGVKIQKNVLTNGVNSSTDYAGNYIYEKPNGGSAVLQFFSTPEGYVEPNTTGGYDYIYQYKDHLGNIRLSYKNVGTASVNLEIQEENNYYPFGLRHKGYNNVVNGVENPYKYNNKELEEDLQLGWYDYGARRYDPAIARWTTQDPLADLYESWSPYNYTMNNPIRYIDPDGMMVSDAISGDDVTNDTDPEPEPIVLDEVVVVAKKKKKSSNWVSWLQTGLDVVGFIPVVGEIADGANALIYLAQGDYVNAGISAAAMIPIVGDLGKGVRLGKKLLNLIDATKGVSGVYEITTKSGKKYIGQSKDVGKRLKQHNKSAKFKSDEIVDVKVTEVKGTDRVNREVFEQRKLNDAGGIDNTLNKRNPIGSARAGEMSRNVSTGKKFDMNK